MIGVIFAMATGSPVVDATVGDGTTVHAGGDVTVTAQALSQSTPGNAGADPDLFTPSADVDPDGDGPLGPVPVVDTANNTIRFPAHGLDTGDRVTCDPDPDGAGSTPANTPIALAGGGALQANREYGVIAVDDDTLKLGAILTAASANTGDLFSPGTGVDAQRGVIRFESPHLFPTGDAVQYSPGASPPSGGSTPPARTSCGSWTT